MKIFLDAVRAALGKETSIEETEEFDRCFYDDRIHRQYGESMAAYIIRRNADFERLNRVVEGGCAIPEKFQTHVQVKYSGLNADQRRLIVSSCGNVLAKIPVEKALRMQFPNIHETDARRPRDQQRPPRRPWQKGPWKPSGGQGFVGDYDEEDDDDDDESYAAEDVEPEGEEDYQNEV